MKNFLLALRPKTEAAQWLTNVPEDNTPLAVATDATREVAYAVYDLVDLFDLRESLRTVVSAMYVSAGLECPDDIYSGEATTDKDVAQAFDTLLHVETEGLLNCLSHNMQRAMDVIHQWHILRYPDDEDEA